MATRSYAEGTITVSSQSRDFNRLVFQALGYLRNGDYAPIRKRIKQNRATS